MPDDPGDLIYQVHEDPGDELREQVEIGAKSIERMLCVLLDTMPADKQTTFSAFLSASGTVLGIGLQDTVRLTSEEAHEALAEYGAFMVKFLRKWGEVAKDRE